NFAKCSNNKRPYEAKKIPDTILIFPMRDKSFMKYNTPHSPFFSITLAETIEMIKKLPPCSDESFLIRTFVHYCPPK
ncbi:hypothetical protein, partial [Bacillus smithii]|uniref:hypothetical protein n=1 Tax=Bacillus smithii TaxID=1479 RepID=UPI003D2588A4